MHDLVSNTADLFIFMFFLLIPILFQRLVKNLLKNLFSISFSNESDVTKNPFFINNFFKTILYFESFLLKYISFPIGLGLVIIAKKNK